MSTLRARLVEEVVALDQEGLRALGDRSGRHRPLMEVFQDRERCARHVHDDRASDLIFRRVPVSVGANGIEVPPLGIEQYGAAGFVSWVHMLLARTNT